MRSIKLTQVETAEIEVLQAELLNYITYKSATLARVTVGADQYFTAVLLIDIAQKLYYNFRSKIEKKLKGLPSITCSASEAIVLLEVCSHKSLRSHYESFVMQKFSGLLHKELINLL